ncbi:MAG: DUF4886 domain-containing protein [Acholeplasma sp.]|nr:DUF4886 domain-containing protein [Acholeplasma sp.]
MRKILFVVFISLLSLVTISCQREGVSDVKVKGLLGDGTNKTPYIVNVFEDGTIIKEISEDFIFSVDGTNSTLNIENNQVKIRGNKVGTETHKVTDKLIKVFYVKVKVNAKGYDVVNDKSYKDSLKILAIGNSFSEDATRYLYDIAKNFGIEEILIVNMYIGGATLEQHVNNIKSNSPYTMQTNSTGEWKNKGSKSIRYALLYTDWDIVTIQQGSPLSGKPDSYQPYMDELITYINETVNNEVQIYWHQTWAYAKTSGHTSFPDYDSNQETMYNAIIEATEKKIINNVEVTNVIPSGTAIQNMRETKVGYKVNSDGHHLNVKGRFTAGLVWFKVLTGYDIDDITYFPEEVDSAFLAIAIEVVNKAVNEPLKVTK